METLEATISVALPINEKSKTDVAEIYLSKQILVQNHNRYPSHIINDIDRISFTVVQSGKKFESHGYFVLATESDVNIRVTTIGESEMPPFTYVSLPIEAIKKIISKVC